MKKIALPYLVGFLFLVLTLLSCSTDSSPSTQRQPVVSKIVPDLQLTVPLGRLRKAPAPDADLVTELEQGDLLKHLGKVSEHTTLIRFSAEQFDEPWLEVQTQTGQTGWIYAREITPLDEAIDRSVFRQRLYLQSVFGKGTFDRINSWRSAFEQASTDKEVAEIYQSGLTMRDSLLSALEEKSYAYDPQSLPDLFWMEKYIPAHVLQLVAEGTVYYLFNNYGDWLDKAKSSSGQQDDQFFALMVQCYPQDSIEYFYPAWEVQTSDLGGHSLLGKGIIRKILSGIEQIKDKTPLFSSTLEGLKGQIIANITQPSTHFWEADSLVKNELDAIIQANWSIFTTTDQIALDTRRLQLDSAGIHGIRFNARAGGD